MSSKTNPYLTIWIKSRATFESFLRERRSSDSIYALPILIYGISLGLSMGPNIYLVIYEDPTLQFKLLTYLFTLLVGIGASHFMLGYLIPWIIKLIGKLWNGKATRIELANVNALSSIPYCFLLAYQLTILATGTPPVLSQINTVFQYIPWLLSIRLLIIGVSVTQKFSYGIALLNIFLAYLPLVMIVLLMGN